MLRQHNRNMSMSGPLSPPHWSPAQMAPLSWCSPLTYSWLQVLPFKLAVSAKTLFLHQVSALGLGTELTFPWDKAENLSESVCHVHPPAITLALPGVAHWLFSPGTCLCLPEASLSQSALCGQATGLFHKALRPYDSILTYLGWALVVGKAPQAMAHPRSMTANSHSLCLGHTDLCTISARGKAASSPN